MRPAAHGDVRGTDRGDVPATRASVPATRASVPATGTGVSASAGIRYGSVAGVVLAFLLLLAFYFTVAAAVHRAELRRQNARLEIDRQAACSVLAQEAERERCAVRLAQQGTERGAAAVVASEHPSNELLSTTWRERHVVARRPHRTAGLY